MKTIAIDFDGVIHRHSKGWHDGTAYDEPMEDAGNSLRWLMEHYCVFILSARPPAQIHGWFAEHLPDIPVQILPADTTLSSWTKKGVIAITQKKLIAAIYIDDRGFRFENWSQIIRHVRGNGV